MKRKNRKRIITFFGFINQIAIYFTMLYIWIASCHYLLFNVNRVSANACFYGGTIVIISYIIKNFLIICLEQKKQKNE